MHELLLYGQVPHARHDQVLRILAGVSAMQPHRLIERHVVYKPQREPEEPGIQTKRGGTQQIAAFKSTKSKASAKATLAKDLYYTQLVRELNDDDFNTCLAQPEDPQSLTAGNGVKYTQVFNDVPEAGDRGGVSVRLTKSTDIAEGDAHAYMVGLGNLYKSEYYLEGHLFVHNHIVIYLHRIRKEIGNQSSRSLPLDTLPGFESLQLLDDSGSYILQAKIRVEDMNDPSVSDLAVAELNQFKAMMKGCVQLAAPDRLDLDTRVKYKTPGVVVRDTRPVPMATY